MEKLKLNSHHVGGNRSDEGADFAVGRVLRDEAVAMAAQDQLLEVLQVWVTNPRANLSGADH